MKKLLAALVVILCGALVSVAAVTLLGRPASLTLTEASAVPVAGQPGFAHVYLKIENGAQPERLLSASSPEAEAASFSGKVIRDSYAIPANGSPSLSGDGVHLVLTGVQGALGEGRLIPISLSFEKSGSVNTRARVGPSEDPHAGHRTAAKGAVAGAERSSLSGLPPTITLDVSPGEGGSWAVSLQTGHFTFVPDASDPVHVPGQGHGHLYLDGVKLQRMYSRSAEIGALPPGHYNVTVSLNTNTHEPYMNDSGPVAASALLVVD